MLAVLSLLLLFAYYFRMLLAPFLAAYIIQFALRPFVNHLEQRDFQHSSSVIIVFVSTFLLVGVLLSILAPAFTSEVASLQENIGDYSKVMTEKVETMKETFSQRIGFMNRILSENENIEQEIKKYFTNSLLRFMQKISQNLFSILSLVLYIAVIPFATFFFLYDDQRIKKKIISLVPNRYFEITLNIIHRLHVQFGLLLRGMLISVVVISLLASAGLWIIGLEYPVVVGIFSGMANLIPYFGPVAGTVAACLVALVTGSPVSFFLYIVLVFLIVNLLDNILVQPIIFSRAANLHPLLIIFLVLAGSKIAGFLGMLLAVPLASLFSVVMNIVARELNRPLRPDFSEYRTISVSNGCKSSS